MLSSRCSLALTLALALAGTGRADGPDIRTVIVEKAEVRSGPSTSTQFCVTNLLHRNDSVEVVQELPDGWLKIKPPRGSFSWVNKRFLQNITPNQPNYVVNLSDEEVPVYYGSEVVKGTRPTIVGAKLKRGTQVIDIDPQRQYADAEGQWMAIESPATECRYLRADTVQRVPGAKASGDIRTAAYTQARSTSSFTPATGAGPSAAPSANPAPTTNDILRAANNADRAGRIEEAASLYFKVAAATVTSNPTLSKQATARGSYLMDSHRYYGTAGAPTTPAETRYSSGVTPAVRPPGARLAAPSTAVPAATTSVARASSPGQQADRRYPGRLRHAGRVIEGRRTYALDVGTYLMYVTPQAGIDLEPFVNRNLVVSGPITYHGDLRSWVMTVTSVQPLP